MRTGTIIRGYNFIDDNKISELENSTQQKVEEIIEDSKTSLDIKFEEFSNMFHKELNQLDTYKKNMENEYIEKISQQEIQFQELLQTVEFENRELMNRLENSLNEYMEDAKNDIKEIMIDLFEKFFFKEYQDMDNLESLICSALSTLKDSQDIRLSLATDYFEKFKEEKKDVFEALLAKDIKIDSHSNESLICEFNSLKGNIEVDFEKQISKIRETVKLY